MKPLAVLALLFLCAGLLRAELVEIRVEKAYLAAGEKGRGVVTLSLGTETLKDAQLRVTALRQIGVPLNKEAKGGTQELLSQSVNASTGEVPFEISAADMIAGEIRVKAELLSGGAPLASAWSAPVEVGFRPRVDLEGDWAVMNVKVFDYNTGHRPKEWKPPEFSSIHLPGPFPGDEWFRAWVTAKREIDWKSPAKFQPRFIHLSGIANSAHIIIDGQDLGETLPVSELAVLTHWQEYHSPFKGEENKDKRMLSMDVDPLLPLTMPLKKPLGADGKTTVELTIRGTHGSWRPHSYGILGDLHIELAADVNIKAVAFDTEKPNEMRRFKWKLTINNESGKEFIGNLRTVYGKYTGSLAYTGACVPYGEATQPLKVPAGESTVEVIRDELPRFETCRAMFIVQDAKNAPVDATGFDFHAVAVEIRNRRDLYVNNERFIMKGQGGYCDDPNARWQMNVKGCNAVRGWNPLLSKKYPGLWSFADMANDRLTDGILTSAGSALLASCEKCIFWDAKDTSNITRAVANVMKTSAHCPGVIIWEATNELHGEPEECREVIQEAFHKLDPYHRPMLATKGSGEWEAEAHEGRVRGTDIVGVQYLLSKEATDSVTAAITEQPVMSTEVNWNDGMLQNQNMWQTWLDKGVCGALLFDYSGNALNQPVPLVPIPNNDQNAGALIRQVDRDLYQDLTPSAERQDDGRLLITLGNRMPYALHNISVSVRDYGKFDAADLNPGDAATVLLPADFKAKANENVAVKVDYLTHGGLKHSVILTPQVKAPATSKGGAKK